jgi:cyclic pyranopterin phosphate synthase
MRDCGYIDQQQILRFEEIHRIVRLFAECGVNKVRLTGGEPLLRRNIAVLVKKLAGTAGIEELTLTTNGVLLEQMANELKAAGLRRINISVDSVERETYQLITGFDLLQKVTRGIYKAIAVGLGPVKINAVVLRGMNESQILALGQISLYLPVLVRFVEYCPTNEYTRPAGDYVPNSEVRKIIERRFGRLSNYLTGDAGGPALYFKIRQSAGAIGFINGRSSIFCQQCNRLRLTSDGKIRPCLYSTHHYDLRELIRSGAGDQQLQELLKMVIKEKPKYTKLNSFTEEFSMREVGG